jgi:GTP 3',8-cyclase
MSERRTDQPAPRPPEAAPGDAVSPEAVLRDALGRRIDYLRVSLTDRCNLRCVYCMPPEGVPKLHHADILSLEELAAITEVLVTDLGVTKVRVTGGEPLIRRGVISFLQTVGRIPGIADLAITTNGSLLEELAAEIRDAGVRRLNISLDTLRAERFLALTGVDGLEAVLRGIAAARRAGFQPIKLNVVVMRSILDETAALLRFGIDQGLEVRFIELMAGHMPHAGEFVPASELLETLSREFTLTPLQPAPGAARLYAVATLSGSPAHAAGSITSARAAASPPGAPGPVCGIIAPVTAPFCDRCDRIRLRADGRLVPCLSADGQHDLKPFVRPRFLRRELIEYIRETVGRSKASPPRERRIRGMSQIGG